MRVLWFSVTPSLYCENYIGHNGGGWISSLESLIRGVVDIELGIAFEYKDNRLKVIRDCVTYYPINVNNCRFNRIKRNYFFKTEEKLLIPECLKIIDDFKPDIIHVFGSEWCFGLIAEHTRIPVVIHIQGSIPPYYNARYPIGYNIYDIILYNGINLKKTLNQVKFDYFFSQRAKREERILANCHFFMGRTDWDKRLSRLYAPKSDYYYCSEALRTEFFNLTSVWRPRNGIDFRISTTISSPLYKGVDLVLKTARLLKDLTGFNFEWRIFGIKNIHFHEWKNKIRSSDVNIKLMGTFSAKNLVSELLESDIFVHPSYIDNSPNSICEAQLLGMPVISTNVGGISTLIAHDETGILVPANDPHLLASYIIQLHNDKELAYNLGKKAREQALKRHNPNIIIDDLLSIYRKII